MNNFLSRTAARRKWGTVATATLVSAGLLALSPAPAGAADGNVSKAYGFSINVSSTAGGKFVGTRTVDGPGTTAVRSIALDPGKKLAATYSVAAPTRTTDLQGAYAGPSARSTARAAYLMSKYGTAKNRITAAALDAAVATLIAPNSKWAFNRSLGVKRLKATGNGGKITTLTKKLLTESTNLSGPYNLSVRASGTDGALTVRFVGKTLAGRPLANRTVDIMVGTDGPFTVKTDSNGRANLALGAQTPGEKTVTATVKGLPDWRLAYFTSRQSNTTRLALAAPRVEATASTRSTVKGDQTLTLSTPSPAVPANFAGRVTINGWGGDRTLTSSLHGPYATAEEAKAAACTASPTYTATATVNEDGTYNLATGASSVGYWTYKVAVAGNAANEPASTCSAPFAAKEAPQLAIARRNATENVGATVPATVTITGLQSTTARTVTVKLFGPFNENANVSCSANRQFKAVNITVRGNGTYKVPGVKLNTAGYYGWSASIPGSALLTADSSPCPPASGAKFRVVS